MTASSLPERETWTPAEVAHILGISEPQIRRLAASGRIPSIRLGGQRVFSKSVVAGWLEAGEIPQRAAEPAQPTPIHKHRRFS